MTSDPKNSSNVTKHKNLTKHKEAILDYMTTLESVCACVTFKKSPTSLFVSLKRALQYTE